LSKDCGLVVDNILDQGHGASIELLERSYALPCSNHQFARDIGRLKRVYQMSLRETRSGKKRFAFYEYLYQVYAVHGHWRADIGTKDKLSP
jgi:hypothetical protein